VNVNVIFRIRRYSPLPPNLQLLEAKSENIFNKLNNDATMQSMP